MAISRSRFELDGGRAHGFTGIVAEHGMPRCQGKSARNRGRRQYRNQAQDALNFPETEEHLQGIISVSTVAPAGLEVRRQHRTLRYISHPEFSCRSGLKKCCRVTAVR